ncbi:MAG: response regulator [Betaproteobacteria bacterium]|nr:response regulator [Betaproteobacteria bacterium]
MPPAESPESAADAAARRSQGIELPILIVDDHPINLRLIQRQAAMLGYESDTASDGREAIEKWQARHYRLILTDCHMPGMDGYTMARRIRELEAARPGAAPVPIVACTANAFEENLQQCLAAGMNDYIAKPLKMDTLRAKLEAWAPPAAAPAAESDSTPIDKRLLREVTGGEASEETEVLMDFRRANEADTLRLNDAFGTGDLVAIMHAAHRIKGACRMVGATALADAAEQIERSAKAGHAESLDADRMAFAIADAQLRAYLDELGRARD